MKVIVWLRKKLPRKW